MDKYQKLEKLFELKETGVLTLDEYEVQKNIVLREGKAENSEEKKQLATNHSTGKNSFMLEKIIYPILGSTFMTFIGSILLRTIYNHDSFLWLKVGNIVIGVMFITILITQYFVKKEDDKYITGLIIGVIVSIGFFQLLVFGQKEMIKSIKNNEIHKKISDVINDK